VGLSPGGRILAVEPPIHISRSALMQDIETACRAGFAAEAGPKIFLSKSRILQKRPASGV